MVRSVVSKTWTHPDSCEFPPCPHKERRQAGHDQHTGKASLYHSGVIPEKKVCSGDNNLTVINSTEELRLPELAKHPQHAHVLPVLTCFYLYVEC